METDRLHCAENARVPCFLNNITHFCRVWGLLTLIMIWTSSIIIIQKERGQTYVGWYLVAVGILLVLLKLIWIMNQSTCISNVGCCCRCFSCLLWVDNWKKGILYCVLSVPLFLEGMRIILGVVSGFFLVVLGLLYVVKTFEFGVIYTREEVRFVRTSTPSMNTVAHEISTQTTDDTYYKTISEDKTTKKQFN